MSNYQLVNKNYQVTEEEGKTLIPSQAEYYLNSLSEWRNIQDIIRLTFKSIVDLVKVQGQSIKEIEQSLSSKASRSELSSSLNLKANSTDIMRALSDISSSIESRATIDEMKTLLEGKISKSDLLYYLKAKPSTEEVRTMMEDKVDLSEYKSDQSELSNRLEVINRDIGKQGGQYATYADVSKLQSKIDAKMSYADYEAKQRVYNESMQISVSKMANKDDVSQLANKDDVSQLDNKIKMINEKALNDSNTIVNMSKRIEDIDQDLDKLIENIKIQFESLNDVIKTLECNIVSRKHIDTKLRLTSSKERSLSPQYNINISSVDVLRKDFDNKVAKINEETAIYNKRLEQNVNEQFNIVMQDVKTAISDIITQKEAFNSFISKNKKDKEGYKQLKRIVNDLSKDYQSLQVQLNETPSLSKRSKCNNINEIEELIKKNIQFHLAIDIMKLKTEFKEEIKAQITSEVNQIQQLNSNSIQSKMSNPAVSLNELINVIDSLTNAINQKANTKDILTLLKNKAEVDEVNNALISIHEELDNKISSAQFNEAIDSQALLNETLCAENIIGRWHWTGGKIKNGFLIPFERQSVNTASDIFIWEMDKTSILIVSSGIFEVTLGFYCSKKPTVQLMINDESILSAVGSGSVLKYGSKGIKGYVAGLTMIEYLLLSPNTKLSISFIGDENGEGFLGLRKL